MRVIIHRGRSKDVGEKATPAQLAEVKKLLTEISSGVSRSNALQSDVQEGIKFLRSAKYWLI